MPNHPFDTDTFATLLADQGARAAEKYRRAVRREATLLYFHSEDPSEQEDRAFRRASGLLQSRGR